MDWNSYALSKWNFRLCKYKTYKTNIYSIARFFQATEACISIRQKRKKQAKNILSRWWFIIVCKNENAVFFITINLRWKWRKMHLKDQLSCKTNPSWKFFLDIFWVIFPLPLQQLFHKSTIFFYFFFWEDMRFLKAVFDLQKIKSSYASLKVWQSFGYRGFGSRATFTTAA